MRSDSPYQHVLSKINEIDLKKDDRDDFKTPPPIKKKLISETIRNVHKKTICKKSLKKTNKSYISKTINDNFGNLDVNSEHLQMALALSKSTYDTNKECQNYEDISLDPSKLSEYTNFGILEKFGFKSNRSKPVQHKPACSNANGVNFREVGILKQNVHQGLSSVKLVWPNNISANQVVSFFYTFFSFI